MATEVKAWRIRHWGNGRFELKSTNGRSDSAMPWIAVPTKHDGKGYLRLMASEQGVTAYGCWILLLAVAAKCPVRGLLADEDGPLTIEDICLKTHCTVDEMRQAITVLSHTEIGWIEQVAIDSETLGGRLECELSAMGAPTDGRNGRTERTFRSDQSRSESEPTAREERRSADKTGADQVSVFDSLSEQDLSDLPRLAKWFRSEQTQHSAPVYPKPTISDLRDIAAAASHALRHGKHPLRLFCTMVGRRDFEKINKKTRAASDKAVDEYLKSLK